jgi:hypothetical protein
VHPIERLRYVARATGAPEAEVVREAAAALAGFADDPVSLVTACRRLIDRHPANGPVWWLCARTLLAADPGDEAWRCFDELHADPTLDELTHALPTDARLVTIIDDDRLDGVLARRGDLDVARFDEPSSDLAATVADADLVLLAATLIGPEHAVVAPGSWEAAAVARTSEVPVWLVAGVGTRLGASLWPAVQRRIDHPMVPTALIDQIVGPGGPSPPARRSARWTCPMRRSSAGDRRRGRRGGQFALHLWCDAAAPRSRRADQLPVVRAGHEGGWHRVPRAITGTPTGRFLGGWQSMGRVRRGARGSAARGCGDRRGPSECPGRRWGWG